MIQCPLTTKILSPGRRPLRLAGLFEFTVPINSGLPFSACKLYPYSWKISKFVYHLTYFKSLKISKKAKSHIQFSDAFAFVHISHRAFLFLHFRTLQKLNFHSMTNISSSNRIQAHMLTLFDLNF